MTATTPKVGDLSRAGTWSSNPSLKRWQEQKKQKRRWSLWQLQRRKWGSFWSWYLVVEPEFEALTGRKEVGDCSHSYGTKSWAFPGLAVVETAAMICMDTGNKGPALIQHRLAFSRSGPLQSCPLHIRNGHCFALSCITSTCLLSSPAFVQFLRPCGADPCSRPRDLRKYFQHFLKIRIAAWRKLAPVISGWRSITLKDNLVTLKGLRWTFRILSCFN